jgi:thiamine-phosphate pyrophosphorylase
MRAQGEGADAVTLGPVFPTPSKAGLGEPLGLERFADACGTLEIPVLALGGVFARNVPALIHAGAAGIAAIRLYWEMKLPEVEIPGLLR